MLIITLLADSGSRDSDAGVLHGVIRSICPQEVIVDLSHDVSPQDVHGAAFVLHTAYPFLPGDTIHVVVVDPELGGTPRAIAVQTVRGTLAPGNGALSYAFAREERSTAVQLTEPRCWLAPLSRNFHGRDRLAPDAAYLA